MKKTVITGLFILGTIFVQGICLAQPPRQLAGFILGRNISEYKDRLKMDTSMPIRYSEWINEVEIKPIDGFKSGRIWFGACASPGRIMRIHLKCADHSKTFYNKLLDRYTKSFGKPAEWRGDPFKIVLAWKWSFTDNEGNRIGLILHHNSKNTEVKMGNTIKLTMGNLLEEEADCVQRKYPEKKEGPSMQGIQPLDKLDWDLFVPK